MAILAQEVPRRHGSSNDPIRVTAKQHGYFPKAFVWRGQQHTIEAVERCWTVPGRTWLGRPGAIARHCFRVRCPEGTYHLYQDLADNSWYIDRRSASRGSTR